MDARIQENVDLISEASRRFGPEKIYVLVPDASWICRVPEYARLGAGGIILSWAGASASGKDSTSLENMMEAIRNLPPDEEEPLRWILLVPGADSIRGDVLAAALKEPEFSAAVLNPAALRQRILWSSSSS